MILGYFSKLFETGLGAAAVHAPWSNMASAPRDGSEIEIKCTYGFEPWVQRARWAKYDFDGPIWRFGDDEKCFTYVNDADFGSRDNGANNSHMQWRAVK